MIKPRALRLGDTIGLVSPSSPIKEDPGAEVEKSAAALKAQGFKVVVDDSCYAKYGYLSGTDEVRAAGVNRMFADKAVDAVFCLRGGYGTPRILDMIDYETVRRNPKLFNGYSDITGLHLAFNKMCGLITMHGTMPAYEMTGDFPAFSKESYLRAITSAEPLGEIINPGGEEIKSLVSGKAQGEIVGGNLSLINATMGTPYEIDTKGKIFFIEEVGEHTYRVDRMLTQLRLAGKFRDCAGVLLGDFANCDVEYGDEYGLSLMQVFKDIIVPAGKPVIYNLKAGHCSPKITLPLGVKAMLDADSCSLSITEAALV